MFVKLHTSEQRNTRGKRIVSIGQVRADSNPSIERQKLTKEARFGVVPSSEDLVRPFIHLAARRGDLYAALRLVYKEYLRTDLIRPNPFLMRATPYHLLPTTDVIVATRGWGDVAACTVSLVGDGQLGLPIESAFPEQVDVRRQRGVQIAEVTSLADDRESEGTGTSLVLQVMSFMAQRARRRGIEELLITVHPHHAKFYEQFIGFEVIGESCAYDSVLGKPAVPLALDLANLHINHPKAYKRFFGKPFPEELLVDQEISHRLRADLRRIVAACEWAKHDASQATLDRAA
jgi:hypothetical protein